MDTLIFTGWTGLSRMLMLAFRDIPTVSSSVSVQDISLRTLSLPILSVLKMPSAYITFAAYIQTTGDYFYQGSNMFEP